MARETYECPVCHRVLKLHGPRNLEFHEKSKFHLDALAKQNGTPQDIPKPQEPVKEDVVIPKTVIAPSTQVHSVQPQVTVAQHQESKQSAKQEPTQVEDDDEFDGYLTF